MKYIIFLFLITTFINAKESVKEINLDKIYLKSINNKELSKKELAYQKYKEKLEIENKKLEDDGFCSCNNN